MDQLNQIKDYIQNKSFEELFEDKNVYVKQDQHEKKLFFN